MISAYFQRGEWNKAFKELEKLGYDLSKVEKINTFRAKKFKEYLQEQLKKGTLGMPPISPGTSKIQENWHYPEVNKGNFVDTLEIKEKKTFTDLGYFHNGLASEKTKRGDKKLSIAQLAILQHNGFRIPLQGDKGEAVRKFLAAHNIYMRASEKWIIVPPRPFMTLAWDKYVEEGMEIRVLEEYLNTIMSKGRIKE